MHRLALVVVGLFACDGGSDSPADAADMDGPLPTLPQRAVIGTGPVYEDGALSELTFDPLSLDETVGPTGLIAQQPILRRFGEELFIVDSSLFEVDLLNARTYAVKERFTVDMAFATDLAISGDRIFVTSYAAPGLLVFKRGVALPQIIDLSSIDPIDHLPNCSSVVVVEDEIYLSCERADEQQFDPRDPTSIVVLDATTYALKAAFQLPDRSQFAKLQYVEALGNLIYPSNDCIHRIRRKPQLQDLGCYLRYDEVGGRVFHASYQLLDAKQILWLIVSPGPDSSADIFLKGYDVGLRELFTVNPPEQRVADFAICPDGQIVILDRGPDDTAPYGVRVYDSDFNELTTQPMSTGFRPISSGGIACFKPGE